jgi:hypothetical protein
LLQSLRTAATSAACLVTHWFRALPYAGLPVDVSAVNASFWYRAAICFDQGPLERFCGVPPHSLKSAMLSVSITAVALIDKRIMRSIETCEV